jgi:O-antigen/teichoic acid export membrane protein
MRQGPSVWHNATVSLGLTVLQGFANFATITYLARVLHPDDYGTFSYSWSVIGIITTLAYFGIPSYLTRQLSRSHNQSVILSLGMSLLGQLSLVITLLFIVGIAILPGSARDQALFILWAPLIVINGLSPRWVFTGIQKLWIASLGDTLTALLRLGLTVALVHHPTNLPAAVWATLVANGLPTVAELWWLRRQYRFRWQLISSGVAYRIIRSGLSLGAISLVTILYSGTDVWILHIFRGSQAVGYYMAAYRPVIFLSMLSTIYFNLTFPILSRLSIRDRIQTQQVLQLATVTIFGIVLPIGTGTVIIATRFMNLLFGPAYAPSGPILAVIVWSWCLSLLRDTYSTTLVAANREHVFFRSFLQSGAVNLGLMLLCVHWGPIGTAIALVVSQGLLLALNLANVARHLGVSPVNLKTYGRYYLKIIVNTGCMAFIVTWSQPRLPIALTIALGGLSYALLTGILRAIPWRAIIQTADLAS